MSDYRPFTHLAFSVCENPRNEWAAHGHSRDEVRQKVLKGSPTALYVVIVTRKPVEVRS